MQKIITSRLRRPGQEQIVLLLTLVIFLFFSFFLEGFTDLGNLSTLMRSVSYLGILGLGMAIVVIGRGLDLSQVAIMAVTSAWVLQNMQNNMSLIPAILLGLVLVILLGVLNGYLIAFVEIPPLFATLATGILIVGAGRTWMVDSSIAYVPQHSEYFLFLGQGDLMGVPLPILVFALVALLVHVFLSRTSYGHFIYAQGDNPETSRIRGIAIRRMTMLKYTLCGVIGFIAGLVMSASIASMNIQIANSTLIFDVLLIIVLGGISLVGGRGSVVSVLVGTALIGTLLNGMTLMDLQTDVQNIIKSLVLLFAILLDNRLHPRNEETARQGDI